MQDRVTLHSIISILTVVCRLCVRIRNKIKGRKNKKYLRQHYINSKRIKKKRKEDLVVSEEKNRQTQEHKAS